jgi:hypothetical protein
VIHLYAEGRSDETSAELEAEVRTLVEQIMQSEEAAIRA